MHRSRSKSRILRRSTNRRNSSHVLRCQERRTHRHATVEQTCTFGGTELGGIGLTARVGFVAGKFWWLPSFAGGVCQGWLESVSCMDGHLVQWQNCSYLQSTFEPESGLAHAQKAIAKYQRKLLTRALALSLAPLRSRSLARRCTCPFQSR
eukprot:COSAG03_NODE_2603_length_2602_cov_164.274071_2_plen_151_part_00